MRSKANLRGSCALCFQVLGADRVHLVQTGFLSGWRPMDLSSVVF